MKTIYLAGGCFWGTQHYLRQIKGVLNTEVGYANGQKENPNYQMVCTGQSGYVELVKVDYDESKISLSFLLDLYYKSINPCTLNRQAGDIGEQYRTGIYYEDEDDYTIAKVSLSNLQKNHSEKIMIELEKLKNYYKAEEYHQDYLVKNKDAYCHVGSSLFELAQKSKDKNLLYPIPSKDKLKTILSKEEYEVTINSATERAFQNKYYDFFEKGIYVDIISKEPLFLSMDKFDSGCGWPSFSKPISEDLIKELEDLSLNRIRTEVRTRHSDSHIGHVFNDGPVERGGLRYCINSASIDFVPYEKMKENYNDYISYFDEDSK